MFVRYSLDVTPTLHLITMFFSHITDRRFWRDAAEHTHGLAFLVPSLADYGLDCMTIQPVAMSRTLSKIPE